MTKQLKRLVTVTHGRVAVNVMTRQSHDGMD